MTTEKNSIIEIEIDNLGINGEGVARYNGKTIFVKNALKGENYIFKACLLSRNRGRKIDYCKK